MITRSLTKLINGNTFSTRSVLNANTPPKVGSLTSTLYVPMSTYVVLWSMRTIIVLISLLVDDVVVIGGPKDSGLKTTNEGID